MFSMTKDTPIDGGLWTFLLNWDQKVGKQSSAGRGLARLTGGKINVGGKPKESDVDVWTAYYRDGAPKRLVVGWNPNAMGNAAGHTGDNQTGAGDDDECTWTDLDKLPAWVTEVIVGVSTKHNGSFGDAMNVGTKVFKGERSPENEVDDLMPTLDANHNVAICLVAKRNKDGEGNILDGWSVRVVDKAGRYTAQPQPGQSLQDAANAGILSFAKANAGF
jgi:stress response protein SCP2